jgi:hypothetical protein
VGRLPLDSGGEILFEASPVAASEQVGDGGPVKAGRIADAVGELPQTFLEALQPVREMAETVVEQLSKARPAEVEMTFGVDLSAQVGAIISKGEGKANLKVRVLWRKDDRE